MAKMDKKKMIKVALCGNDVNIAEMNMALYGTMDPDTEILRGVSKKMFESAMPRLMLKKRNGDTMFGVPIIYGTGGGMNGEEYYKMMQSAINDYNVPLFIPANQEEESGKFSWYDKMEESVNEKRVGWAQRYHEWLKEHPPMKYDPNELIDEIKFREIMDKLSKQ